MDRMDRMGLRGRVVIRLNTEGQGSPLLPAHGEPPFYPLMVIRPYPLMVSLSNHPSITRGIPRQARDERTENVGANDYSPPANPILSIQCSNVKIPTRRFRVAVAE